MLRHVMLQGEDVLMSEATSLWASSVQLTSIIVDHLMGKRWVSGAAVLRWLFGPQALGMRSADDAMECLKCTDILHNTVVRFLARTQVTEDSTCLSALDWQDTTCAAMCHNHQTRSAAMQFQAQAIVFSQGFCCTVYPVKFFIA